MKADLTFDEELGALIRLYRVAIGRSEPDLAEATGLDKQQIARIERGLENLSVKQFEEIAYALGIRPSEVLEQLQRRMTFLDSADAEIDRRTLAWLSSNRGRQIIRAMATCKRPEVLDAIGSLLLAASTGSLPRRF